MERRSAGGSAVTAATDVSFEVATGEFVCLLGPSGCGKTSILNVLAGLDRPSAGQALVDGAPITGPGPDRAVLFQEPALFPWLSVAGERRAGPGAPGPAGRGAARARDALARRTSTS